MDKAEYYLILFNNNNVDVSNIENAFYVINEALDFSNTVLLKISNYYSDLYWLDFEGRLIELIVEIFHIYESVDSNNEGLSLLSSFIKKSRLHNKNYYLNRNLSHNIEAKENLFDQSRRQINTILEENGICTEGMEHQIGINSVLIFDNLYKTNGIRSSDSLLVKITSQVDPNTAVLDYLIKDTQNPITYINI